MRRFGAAIAAAVMIAGAVPLTSVFAQQPETPLLNGVFYTQGSGTPGLGFAVVDDANGDFYSTYAWYGGAAALGYPLSRRFSHEGADMQVFQKHVLHATPGGVTLLPTLDVLSQKGLDQWLNANYQIPPVEDLSGTDPLAILETAPNMSAAYWGSHFDPTGYMGYPTARVVNYADGATLRTQRTAIYERLSGVTFALVGEIARASGVFPAGAFQPQSVQQATAPATTAPVNAPTGGSQSATTESLVVSAVVSSAVVTAAEPVRIAVRVTDAAGRPLAGAAVIAIVHYPPKSENEAWAVDGVFFGTPTDDRGQSVVVATIDPTVPVGLGAQIEVSAVYPPGGGQSFVDVVIG